MKNPAVLWYPSDFIASTIFWNNEQCGAYIRLLNYQFTLGHLSMEQIQQITTDKTVLSKFIEDENGLYYNQRLEKEIEKRQKYSESRSKNKLGKTKTSDKDMNNISKTYDYHMGNENVNINIIDYFNNNIHMIVQKEYEELTNWEKDFNDEMIIKAIDEAILHNGKSMSYISSILRNWKEKGYKKPEDVKPIKRKKENNVPEWVNKKIDKEEINDEELAELEREMEIFD